MSGSRFSPRKADTNKMWANYAIYKRAKRRSATLSRKPIHSSDYSTSSIAAETSTHEEKADFSTMLRAATVQPRAKKLQVTVRSIYSNSGPREGRSMRPQAMERNRSMALEAEKDRLCLYASNTADERRFERCAVEGLFVSPYRGLFADAKTWANLDGHQRSIRIIRTLAKRNPDWTFCAFSAAIMHGLWVANKHAAPVSVACKPPGIERKGVWMSRRQIPYQDSCMVDGVRVTPLLQTAVDCLLLLDFGGALAIADSALRAGLTKNEILWELDSRLDDEKKAGAREVVSHADARSESGGESMARAIMIQQGFQIPELQVEVQNVLSDDGLYRLDYVWQLQDGSMIGGEFDGREKYRSPLMTGGRDVVNVLADERIRESRIGALGFRVMRIAFSDIAEPWRLVKLMQMYGIPRNSVMKV